MQDYAQEHAAWTDRTSNARQGLAFIPDHPARLQDGARGYLIHSIQYGVYLEFANGGKYAILKQSVQAKRLFLKEGLKRIWTSSLTQRGYR